jgi:Skp family chaperone for outer membrane proteins
MPKIFWIVLVLISIACNKNKTGYVNITEIYNKIDLADIYRNNISNYESKIQLYLAKEKQKVDSLKSVVALEKASQNQLKAIYQAQLTLDSLEAKLVKALKDSTIFLNQDIEQKVNNWVYEYGKVNAYQYIFSPLNTNTFMYADSVLDITQPVIEFINAKK